MKYMDVKIDKLCDFTNTFEYKLVTIDVKGRSCSTHRDLIEHRQLEKEDENLLDMCKKDMSQDLSNPIKKSETLKDRTFHHSIYVVASNLALTNDETLKHTFQSFVNNKHRMVGVNVT